MRSVSIIIPTYARPELDPGLVQALADQTYAGPVQVIVVDNNAEPTVKVPENWISVHEPTPGSYAARNAGVAAATGDVLAFTDDDCCPDPSWLERAVAALARNPRSAIGGRVRLTTRPSPSAAESYEKMFDLQQRRFVASGFAATANLVVEADDFARVGRFDASLFSGGDVEWGRRAGLSGVTIIYADDVLVLHRARRTTREVLRKHRRVTGGQCTLALRRNGRLTIAIETIRPLVPPLRSLGRVLTNRSLGFGQRLRVLPIIVAVYFTRLFWRGVFLVGGSAVPCPRT